MDWKTSNVISYTNSFPCKSLQLLNYKKINVIQTSITFWHNYAFVFKKRCIQCPRYSVVFIIPDISKVSRKLASSKRY